MPTVRLMSAAAAVFTLAATAVLADDVKGDAPKAPPSQSTYMPEDKTGASSPAKPVPPVKDEHSSDGKGDTGK